MEKDELNKKIINLERLNSKCIVEIQKKMN